MPEIVVTTRGGEARRIAAEPGRTLMEVIRDAGFDELLALCGGCCSCATCHTHVDAEWLERLPPISEDEDDLLKSSSDRDGTSRLACQLPFAPALSGLDLRIAAED